MKSKILNLIIVNTFLIVSNSVFCSSQNVDFPPEDYCARLSKYVSLLKTFNKLNKEKKIVDFNAYESMPFLVRNIEYKNEIVKRCIKKMVETSSIDPLLKTWKYAYALCISREDENFMREFSILIFSVYENLLIILTAHRADRDMKGTLEDIIQVYNAVADLPIKEILLTLERCYTLFSKILRDYGAFSNMSWVRWAKKYWWLPPTIIIAVAGALLSNKISKPRFSSGSRPSLRNPDDEKI